MSSWPQASTPAAAWWSSRPQPLVVPSQQWWRRRCVLGALQRTSFWATTGRIPGDATPDSSAWLAQAGLGVLSEAQALACAEHVPAASSGYIAGGIERLKRGLGFSKSAIDAGRAARAPPPAPVLRMRAAAYAGGQFIRSMAATAVGWCPREEALEVQEVEMKVFNFKNLEDLEHLEPTRQFDEEVEEVEGWLLLPEDSEALVRQEFADVLRMSGELPLNCWALAV